MVVVEELVVVDYYVYVVVGEGDGVVVDLFGGDVVGE